MPSSNLSEKAILPRWAWGLKFREGKPVLDATCQVAGGDFEQAEMAVPPFPNPFTPTTVCPGGNLAQCRLRYWESSLAPLLLGWVYLEDSLYLSFSYHSAWRGWVF